MTARKPDSNYTMTPAAQAQRRAAAQLSTGPVTEEGKASSSRNGWKHGLNSAIHKGHFDAGMASLIGAMGKPCLTTCPKYPCGIVDDGLTKPGGSCLDKQVYVQAFGAIIDAVEGGNFAGIHGLMATEIAAQLQLMHDLRSKLADQGIMLVIPAINNDGQVITRKDGSEVASKFVLNPAYPAMLKALEVLGINLPELVATPAARVRAKVGEEAADAVQTLMGGIMQRVAAAKRGALPAPSGD